MAARQLSVRARLAAAGLDPDEAQADLERIGCVADGQVDEELLTRLSEAASPQQALRSLTDLADNQPELFEEIRADGSWLGRVIAVAGTSRPLGDLVARYRDAARALETLDRVDVTETARRVEAAVAKTEDPAEQAAGIAAIRRQATADIAARDLTGEARVDEVAAELAALAEAVLTGTLRAVHRQAVGDDPAARIAVIGMGKLGGYELNYVSDVDVVFVHAPTGDDEEAAGKEVKQVLTRLLDLLNSSTTMGRAYEVDPNLRPEGRSGPLSRTVGSFVSYWERWAKTWEFQALVKARPVAGDPDLGQDLLAAAEPFLWPDRLEPGVVLEIRDMKSRIEAKPEVLRHGERQIKLGPGGLRDIEFTVQLLQLVHGRADRTLRVTGTLPALGALARNGYVAEEDAEAFGEAYRRLRNVEHRLQLAHERRTHTVPDDPDRQEWLARSLGYRSDGDSTARERFLQELSRVQSGVRELHGKLFYRPLLEAAAALPASAAGVSLPGEVTAMGDEAARTRLEALGFRDSAAALRDVRALTAGLSRRARTVRAVMPSVLQVLQETPDPDTGLSGFRKLVEAHGTSAELLNHLRDHPPAAELLARVLGTSRVAGDLLVDQPKGVEWLRDETLRDTARNRDDLVRRATKRLAWQDATAALRRFKRLELLRIVLRDLATNASVSVIGEELTALGEACLEAALLAELRARAHETGVSGSEELPVRMAIIGMGKLGGRELHYVSDLDVLFVHEAANGADEKEATKLALDIASRVMRSLGDITAEGTAFEVDADLRPEGRSGPLSRSLDSYRSYWGRWSEGWEHQALLKARPVAGNEELARGFVEAARELAYPATFDDKDLSRMRRMKARIERERIPRRLEPVRHLKLGPGGLSDVEWTVQLLQQQHGGRHQVVRTTGTMAALDALQDDSIIEHRDADWLREGYRFLSEMRNRLYLLKIRNVDVMPTAPQVLETLALSMGYPRGGWQELEEDRRRHARHVRRVTERLFYGVDPTFSPFDDR